jgi:hypothetical protein
MHIPEKLSSWFEISDGPGPVGALIWIFLVTMGLSALTCVTVYTLVPEWRNQFADEDSLIEWCTAVFYLGGFLLGMHAVSRSRAGRRVRLLLLAVPMLCLLGLLEELSYGERLFGFQAPEIYGTKFDALHDIGLLVSNVFGGAALLATALGSAGIAFWLLRRVDLQRRAFELLKAHPALRFVLAALILGLLAQVIDLGFASSRLVIAAEESLEMYGALAMLFAAIAIPKSETS